LNSGYCFNPKIYLIANLAENQYPRAKLPDFLK